MPPRQRHRALLSVASLDCPLSVDVKNVISFNGVSYHKRHPSQVYKKNPAQASASAGLIPTNNGDYCDMASKVPKVEITLSILVRSGPFFVWLSRTCLASVMAASMRV